MADYASLEGGGVFEESVPEQSAMMSLLMLSLGSGSK